ncbi:GNAT family N-acetyltransferase [Arthrobacter sp. H14-L1]|nr:GNAT family N-acetyltransferase [Arthrobacter sp. H14-L1]
MAQGYRRGLEAGTAAWVAEDETHIVGIATASQPREENPPRALELRTLYLLSAHYGSGAGQGLLDASVGTGPCMLRVASENPRAIAFYRRNGFTLDGAQKIEK